ncbi:MAG: DUF4340 domain-containing protein [Gammaproteobacteria bacterium]
MTARHVALLAGLAALAVVLAWALGRTGGGADSSRDMRLLPQLQEAVNDVAGIVIEPAGEDSFRVSRESHAWVAPGLLGYRADAGQVRRLVLRLAEARILETKTANPALYARLGVGDPAAGDGAGTRVTLEGVPGLAPVIIGDRESPGGRGTYVRRSGEDTAWLVDQMITVESAPLDWLDRDVMDVPADEVMALEIRHPGGGTLSVQRDPDSGQLVLASLPEGRQLSGPTAPAALARALAGLRLDDVRPAAEVESEGDPVVARFTLSDSTVIEARTRTIDETPWTIFEVRPGGGDSGATATAALQGRVSGWAYALPAWKAEQLTRRTEDLLKPLPETD